MSKQTNDMTGIIRAAFRESGLSMKRLSDRAGTRYASVHGFFATHDCDAKLSTVQAWCNVLGLSLKPETKGRNRENLQNKLSRPKRPKA